MKYRKKPVVIDALQWTGKNHREMFDFLTENSFDEEHMIVNGDHFYIDHINVKGGLVIKTLEGDHVAKIGDYIIRGVKGEYYPCKEDMFHQTYEPVTPEYPLLDGTNYIPKTYIPKTDDNLVPYHTVCSCSPKNGGSGVCGCTMANTLVDKKFWINSYGTNTTNDNNSYPIS